MSINLASIYIESARFRFASIKDLGDNTLSQIDLEDMLWRSNPEVNSIAVIIQHLHGNMLSRWTDFLTTDGEKPTRDRDGEFNEPPETSKAELLDLWESGWRCVTQTINLLTEDDLGKNISIRGQELTVIDALNRQISHYAYHIGQIVHIAKERLGKGWQTLSIARGESQQYMPSSRN